MTVENEATEDIEEITEEAELDDAIWQDDSVLTENGNPIIQDI